MPSILGTWTQERNGRGPYGEVVDSEQKLWGEAGALVPIWEGCWLLGGGGQCVGTFSISCLILVPVSGSVLVCVAQFLGFKQELLSRFCREGIKFRLLLQSISMIVQLYWRTALELQRFRGGRTSNMILFSLLILQEIELTETK